MPALNNNDLPKAILETLLKPDTPTQSTTTTTTTAQSPSSSSSLSAPDKNAQEPVSRRASFASYLGMQEAPSSAPLKREALIESVRVIEKEIQSIKVNMENTVREHMSDFMGALEYSVSLQSKTKSVFDELASITTIMEHPETGVKVLFERNVNERSTLAAELKRVENTSTVLETLLKIRRHAKLCEQHLAAEKYTEASLDLQLMHQHLSVLPTSATTSTIPPVFAMLNRQYESLYTKLSTRIEEIFQQSMSLTHSLDTLSLSFRIPSTAFSSEPIASRKKQMLWKSLDYLNNLEGVLVPFVKRFVKSFLYPILKDARWDVSLQQQQDQQQCLLVASLHTKASPTTWIEKGTLLHIIGKVVEYFHRDLFNVFDDATSSSVLRSRLWSMFYKTCWPSLYKFIKQDYLVKLLTPSRNNQNQQAAEKEIKTVITKTRAQIKEFESVCFSAGFFQTTATEVSGANSEEELLLLSDYWQNAQHIYLENKAIRQLEEFRHVLLGLFENARGSRSSSSGHVEKIRVDEPGHVASAQHASILKQVEVYLGITLTNTENETSQQLQQQQPPRNIVGLGYDESSLFLFPKCHVSKPVYVFITEGLWKLFLESLVTDDDGVEDDEEMDIRRLSTERLFQTTRDLSTLYLTLLETNYQQYQKSVMMGSSKHNNNKDMKFDPIQTFVDLQFVCHELNRLNMVWRKRLLSIRQSSQSTSTTFLIDYIHKFQVLSDTIFWQDYFVKFVETEYVLGPLMALNGFDCLDGRRKERLQSALVMVCERIFELTGVWRAKLPSGFATHLIYTLLDSFYNTISRQILALIDIAEEESATLSQFLNDIVLVPFLDRCQVGKNPRTGVIEISSLATKGLICGFEKLRIIGLVLDMNFSELMNAFRQGELVAVREEMDGSSVTRSSPSIEERCKLTRMELVGLVKALFADTELRRKNLSEIMGSG